jgi:hypothetical protein
MVTGTPFEDQICTFPNRGSFLNESATTPQVLSQASSWRLRSALVSVFWPFFLPSTLFLPTTHERRWKVCHIYRGTVCHISHSPNAPCDGFVLALLVCGMRYAACGLRFADKPL